MDSNQVPKSILFAFFEGKATAMQRKMIEEWLETPASREYFYQCLDEWEGQHPQYILNEEHIHQALNQILDNPPLRRFEPPTKPAYKNIFGAKQWLVAASVALVIMTASWVFRKTIFFKTYHTDFAQTQTLTLHDGSAVTLNANSSLLVPRFEFYKKQREVWLEGEAEFKVTHTHDHKRFVVKTDSDFAIEVLGTEFVVQTRKKQNSVVLNQGKVKVNYALGKALYMKPGELFVVNKQSGKAELKQVAKPQQYSAWKQHEFYFDNTPFVEVAELIYDQFGLKMSIPDSALAQRKITGYFKAKRAEDMLSALQMLLEVRFERKENNVIEIHTRPIINL